MFPTAYLTDLDPEGRSRDFRSDFPSQRKSLPIPRKIFSSATLAFNKPLKPLRSRIYNLSSIDEAGLEVNNPLFRAKPFDSKLQSYLLKILEKDSWDSSLSYIESLIPSENENLNIFLTKIYHDINFLKESEIHGSRSLACYAILIKYHPNSLIKINYFNRLVSLEFCSQSELESVFNVLNMNKRLVSDYFAISNQAFEISVNQIETLLNGLELNLAELNEIFSDYDIDIKEINLKKKRVSFFYDGTAAKVEQFHRKSLADLKVVRDVRIIPNIKEIKESILACLKDPSLDGGVLLEHLAEILEVDSSELKFGTSPKKFQEHCVMMLLKHDMSPVNGVKLHIKQVPKEFDYKKYRAEVKPEGSLCIRNVSTGQTRKIILPRNFPMSFRGSILETAIKPLLLDRNQIIEIIDQMKSKVISKIAHSHI